MTKQLSDRDRYKIENLEAEFLQLLIDSFRYYGELLRAQPMLENPVLLKLMPEGGLAKSPAQQEYCKVENFIAIFQRKIDNSNQWPELTMAHRDFRFIKSVVELYLKHLRRERDNSVRNAQITKMGLEVIDAQINSFANKLGVFEDAELVELLVGIPDEIEDQSSQKLTGQQININGNVSGSTIIIGDENNAQNLQKRK